MLPFTPGCGRAVATRTTGRQYVWKWQRSIGTAIARSIDGGVDDADGISVEGNRRRAKDRSRLGEVLCMIAGKEHRMAQRSRPTISKRQREQARIAKQKDKAARRAEKATRPKSLDGTPEGVDPDIAGIRPGPQPPADWQIEDDE